MKTTEQQIAAHESNPICLRTELRKEFVRRCKLNAVYSMRAYAKFLQVDQSLLSKLMNGQRRISDSVADKIAPKLKIKPSQLLQTLQNYHSARSLKYQQMADDEVSVLAEWSHFAILELIKTKNFKLDIKWMAERLSLHTQEVADALDRLVRMGFIKITEQNRVELLRVNNDWTNTTATTVARQELQRSLLQKALTAIEKIAFSNRENASLTVAIRADRLPEFKEKLKKMRDELDVFFQPEADAGNFDEVYQLTLAFYPLTNIEQKLEQSLEKKLEQSLHKNFKEKKIKNN